MFGHTKVAQFRTRRNLLFAVITTSIISLAAAGSQVAAFSFMDSVRELLGAESGQARVSPFMSEYRAFSPAAPPVVCSTPPSGMISWWAAENNPGDNLNRNNGVLLGNAGFSAGMVGSALNLDGNGDYIQVATPTGLPVGNAARTVELWFRAPATPGESGLFQYGTANGGQMFGLITSGNAPGRLYFYGHSIDVASTTVIQPNTWYHGAVTYDGTTAKIYVNGILENWAGPIALNTVLDANGITIGHRAGGSFWTGQLDEPTIYDRALSDSEILAIYNAGSAGKCSVCTPPPSGMVAWYGGDGNANDLQGNYPGVLQGGTLFTAGKVRQAFSFDGSDDYVDAGNINLANRSFSFDAWVKRNSSSSADLILGQGTANIGQGLHIGWRAGSNDFTFDFFNSTLNVADTPDTNWHHWAGSYNVTNGEKRIYKDGQLVGSNTGGGYSGGGSLWIGRSPWVNGDWVNGAPLDGLMDEVEIFDRVVSQAEFQAIYNAASAGKCASCTSTPSGMVGWWKGEGNGLDTANGNNGSLVNGVSYAPGNVGQAFSFDPSLQQYVDVSAVTLSLMNNSAGTISSWVNQSPVGAAQFRMVAAFGSGAAGEAVGFGIDNGNVRVYHHTDTFDWQTGVPITPSSWTFLAYTWDGTTERLYKNGSLAASRARNFNFVNTGYARIGFGFINDPSVFFAGQIDELSTFNRTLDAAEIASIYNAGSLGMCRNCTPAPANMTQWWPGDGSADDIQGPTFENGTLNGATFAPGLVAQAINFDGVNDNVDIGGTPIELASAPFTVDFWMKTPDASHSTHAYLMGKSHPDGGLGWDIRVANNAISVVGVNGWAVNITSNASITANSWHHVGVISNGSTVELYIDGVLKGSCPRAAISSTANPMRFGFTTNFGGLAFHGLLDEIEIFDRGLTQLEIQAIYNAGSSGKCKPVCTPLPLNGVSWWNASGNPNDTFGTNNGVLLNGAGYATGKVGQAFDFSGTNDYLQVATPVGLPVGATPRTMMLWFKTPNSWTDTYPLMMQYGGTSPSTKFGLMAVDVGGRKLYFWGENNDLVGNTVLQPNTWYHGAVTYDGSTVKLYLNGQPETSQAKSLNTFSGSDFTLGRYGSNSAITGEWNGLIDEAVIFSRELSQAEIQAVFDAGSSGTCEPVATPPPTATPTLTPTPTATPTDSPTATPTATPTPEPTCAPPPAGMIAWWPGDGNANDIQGPTFENGTLINGAAYAAGMVGQAFSFDGIDDSVVVPSTTILEPNALTLDAWIFVDAGAPPSGNYGIIGKYYSVGGLRGYEIFIDNGKLVLRANSTNQTYAISTNDVIFGQWNHVAATIDSSSSYLYINGNLEGSGAGVPAIEATNQPFVIGARGGDISPGAYFIGRIDEAEVFSRALSGAEVSAIFNAGSAGKCRTCTQPPPDMVTWWPGDGNANDIQGPTFENASLMNHTNYAPGMVGQAFSFDGADDYLEVPHSAELNLTGGFTLDTWFKQRTAGYGVLFSKGDYNGTASITSYGLQIDPDGSLNAALYGTFPEDNLTTAPGLVTTGLWYHVALTWDGTYGPANNVKLYLNGNLVQSWTKSATPLHVTTQSLTLGSMKPPTYYGHLDGLIDEPEIYSRALSASEIAAIYIAGSAGKCRTCTTAPANIYSWWKAENNADDSVGMNDGTMTNGATFASGMVGQAFSLDGSNDVVRVDHQPNISFAANEPMTAYMWVYPTALPDTHLLGKRGTCYDAGQSANYQLGYGISTGLNFNAGGNVLSTGIPLLLNTWQHVAVTADGANLRLYMNGQQVGSAAGTLGPETTAPLMIGGACDGVGATFPGRLDEVTVVGRAMSAIEIQAIYKAGSAGICPATTVQTSTAVSSSANPSVYSDSVTFTATVSPIPLGGTVQFNIDGADVGVPVTINGSGQAAFMTSSLTVNGGTPHTITASYSGFDVYVASTGSLIPGQTVNPAPSTTTINCAPGTFVYTGSPITPCTATVTGADLNTTVPVTYAGNMNVGTATANASYPGGPNHSASVATEVTFQITPGPTVTTITGDINDPSVYGETITVNFTVVAPGGGTPTGNVVITVSGGAETCTGTVAAGSCSIQLNGIGARTVTAIYAGGGNFLGSLDTEAHTVNKADTTTAIISDNPDPSAFGQNYTVVFSVVANSPGAGTPTGTVSVSDGTNNCSATVAVGQCVLPSTSPGSKTLTANYPGDSFFNGSSDTEAHQVDKANTTTTITASPVGPSVFGQSVTFTATVAVVSPGAGSPTGTVSFNIDGNLYCVNTPVNGSFEASCTQAGLPGLPAGVRNVVAIYNGDANFNGSAGTLNYTVNKANTTTVITNDTPDPSIVGQTYAVHFAVEATVGTPERSAKVPAFGTPTGMVTVSDGAGNTCTASVSAGTCSLTSTTVGEKSLVAQYSGDTNYNGSISVPESHSVMLLMDGRVMRADTMEPLAGVIMTMTGYDVQNRGFVITTTTDPLGYYKFEGYWYGDCTIAPGGLGKVYEPVSRSYESVVSNHTGIDFFAYDDGTMPRELSLPTVYVTPGDPIAIPVTLESLGNEASIAFTVGYDFNPFAAPPSVTCGADAPGCALTVDISILCKIGITVVPGEALTAGPKRLVTLTFQSHPITTGPNSPLVFEIAEPTQLAILNSSGDPLPVSLKNGMIVFALGIEGDVTGRNAGDGVVDSTDIVLVRRFIAGLETVAPEYNEFQRADTAPAYSKGDGSIDATDVIQARRYASALDPPQAAGGPGIPLPPPGTLAPRNPDRERTRMIGVGTIEAAAGSRITLPVEINAEGDETAVSLTFKYDHTKLSGPDVVLANGQSGGILTFGAREPGVVRLLVEPSETFGSSSTKAIPLVLVSFDVLETAASGETPVEIEDLVVSDANARILTASSVSGMVSISGPNAAGVEVSGRVMTADGRGIRNAIVLIVDHDRNIRATTTGSFGHYRFRGVPPDAWYLLRVQARRFRFIPRRIHVTGPMTDVDLIALE